MLDEDSGVAANESVAKLAALAHGRLGEMSDVQEARGLHGVLASMGRVRGATSRHLARRLLWVGAGATALVLLVVLVGPSLWGRPTLTFSMVQGEIQAGGYFRAGTQERPMLQFSDGTQIDLLAGARGRVATVGAHGARVMLDEGETYVRVVPRADARWIFDAGPFVVQVQGTEFALAWRGGEGRLDVRLHQGAVSVTGPLSEQAIALRPGQWLTVRLAKYEVFVRDFDRANPPALSDAVPTPPPAAESALAPPPPAAEPASELPRVRAKPRRPAPAPTVPTASPEQAWAPARADGDWDRILDLATRRGLERSLAERNSEDLALLADAAHYRNRDDIAQKALLAQRQRFSGSTRAKDAAFLLGRIVEAKTGGAEEALGWYDRHLAEAPDGAYASEALGRKMTVLARLRGDEAARPVAEEYLRRYPGGSYARAARAYASKP